MGKLYTVNVDGQKERSAGPDMGVYATFSPDGKKLAVNRKSQSYWRKYYRGSYQTDVTVMDIAAKKFTDLTDFDGMDSWPMWSRDGHIYFVSDREGNGLTNLWRVRESGGEAEQVTSFKAGDVRWPAMSADGKMIVFEHDFGVWKLDVAGRKAAPIKLDIAAETQENLVEVARFQFAVGRLRPRPSGRRIAFRSTASSSPRRPTKATSARSPTAPARPGAAVFARRQMDRLHLRPQRPRRDLRRCGRRRGRAAEGHRPRRAEVQLFVVARLQEIAFTASDSKLAQYDAGEQADRELTSSKLRHVSAPVVVARRQMDRLLEGGSHAQHRRLSDPLRGRRRAQGDVRLGQRRQPALLPDGAKLYFVRNERRRGGGGGQASAQIYYAVLEREDRDPNDPEMRPEQPEASDQEGGPRRAGPPQRNQPPREIDRLTGPA